jgi:N-acetylmuramate 1-kinase
MNRIDARDALLSEAGYGDALRQPMPVDCSYRSYTRLSGGPQPALLMDAPPGLEPLKPFVILSRHLGKMQLSAPAILASDFEQGYALIEDFGEGTFTRLLDEGADPWPLYTLAVDTLIALQKHPENTAVVVPVYDLPFLQREAALFCDWYWPAARGEAPPDAVRERYHKLMERLLTPLLDAPPVLVLRDFHVDNLMVLSNRNGVAACGLLDFQDALLGHPAYDLVSLLQDERRDVAPELSAAMTARYAAALPGRWDATAYWTYGVQRHLKNLGVFARQSRRDSRHQYLVHVPRMWRWIELCLKSEPTLAPLAKFLAEHWPDEQRLAPPLPEPEP